MPEMPRAREDHGNAFFIGGLDDLGVTHRATGLDGCSGSSLGGGKKAVGKREEGITANDTAFKREPSLLSLPHGDA